MIKSFQTLDFLIEEIQDSSNAGKWFLSTERLISILDIKLENFYKKAYFLKKRNNHFIADYKKGFHHFEVDSLIFLLIDSNWKLESLKDIFISSGIYLKEDFLDLFKKFSFGKISGFIEKHKIDNELLQIYVSATKSFDDAFDSYLGHINFQILTSQIVDFFVESQKISTKGGIDLYLKRFLNQQFDDQTKEYWIFIEPLKQKCYQSIFGYSKKPQISNKKLKLLKFFMLRESATQKDLKQRFNQMIKKYHPDVNKNGEEMTKKILSNYSLLIQIWDQ